MSIYCVCLVNFSYIYINVKYMNVTLRMSNPSHLPVSLELIVAPGQFAPRRPGLNLPVSVCVRKIPFFQHPTSKNIQTVQHP